MRARARVRSPFLAQQYPIEEGGGRGRGGFVFQEGIKRDFSVLWKRKKKKKKNEAEDRSKGAEIEQKLDNIRAYTRRGQAIDSVSRGVPSPYLPPSPPHPSWLINFHVRSFRVELPNVISPGAVLFLRRNQVASVAQRTRNKRSQISIRRVSKEMNDEKARG